MYKVNRPFRHCCENIYQSSITANEIIKILQISFKSYKNHKIHLASICIVLSDNKFKNSIAMIALQAYYINSA